MTDPMEALKSLQLALNNREVQLNPCSLHAELKVMLDNPGGTPRFTYASLDKQRVKGIALLVLVEPVDGLPCFQIGYAVAEEERSKGLGTQLLEQSIAEFQHGMSRTPMKEFYFEAIVGEDNQHSLRIADKVLGSEPKAGTDSVSGEPMFQYFKKVCCHS